MFCKGCHNSISHKEAKQNKGYCPACIEKEQDKRKISNDLLTSFGGKGKRGFVQWLKLGNFLTQIGDEAEAQMYNDRCNVIEALIGGREKIDKLLDGFADLVLSIAKQEVDSES